MRQIIEDLSKLTTISSKNLKSLNSKEIYCISDAVEESLLTENTITSVDIGIGILHIQHSGEEIKYKFIPSEELNKAVVDTVKSRLNSLEIKVKESLVEKFTNLYKDLF